MKTLIFVSVAFCALLFGSMSSKSTATSLGQKQKAVTQFDQPVTVQGVTLKGQYLFVHDDAAMNRGDACTFIYKDTIEAPDKLVASFHCIHVERRMAKHFTVRTLETAPGHLELREFQFGGDTAAHAVPVSPMTAVVPVMN